jgi:hypothetical protein
LLKKYPYRNKTALPGLILPFRHPLKYKASAAVHLSSVYFFILKLVVQYYQTLVRLGLLLFYHYGYIIMRLNVAATPASASTLATNKVLRNTYMLLSLTLLFSAFVNR